MNKEYTNDKIELCFSIIIPNYLSIVSYILV
ncbi:hypothetical protein lpari_00609 [Legionella parisiensis]|uniref:Uncharacterized protein n=1 Tax=Legionella parisiensis TaxID=45071 RepID=A0A1E5JVE5_9GAMM|nr:hypothetical protein lpari_00609 [Legionella parisiensis]